MNSPFLPTVVRGRFLQNAAGESGPLRFPAWSGSRPEARRGRIADSWSNEGLSDSFWPSFTRKGGIFRHVAEHIDCRAQCAIVQDVEEAAGSLRLLHRPGQGIFSPLL